MVTTMAYTKLFNKVLASSIWNEDDKTRIVWITMLAMQNQRHIVEGSVGGLAHMARVSLEDTHKALAVLSSPDPDDSSKVDDGRRIRPLDHGGWLIVNGEVYRKAKDEDERRARWAAYMRGYRQRQREEKDGVINGVIQCNSPLNPVNTNRIEEIRTEQNRTEEIRRPAALNQFVTREMVEEYCKRKHWSHKLISIAWAKLMGGKYYGTPILDDQTFSDTMETIYADWKP